MYGSLAAGFGLLAAVFGLIDLSLCIYEGELSEKMQLENRFDRLETILENIRKNDIKNNDNTINKNTDEIS